MKMNNSMPENSTKDLTEPVSKRPTDCSDDELSRFEELVNEGGQVDPDGLSDRIREAEQLVFLYDNEALAGIAALKHPTEGHRRKVFNKAKSEERPQDFVFEVGYICVQEKFRDKKYSRPLLEAALGVAGDKPIFATTRQDNEAMKKTLTRYGFKVSGAPYKSDRGDHSLILYTKRVDV